MQGSLSDTDISLVVQEWSPATAQNHPDLSALHLWVDFKSVPGHIYSYKGLSFLANIVGKTVKLHPNTERCIRLDVACVLVCVNLLKPLPGRICIREKEKPQESFEIVVSYPWLPPCCSAYNLWGHKVNECTSDTKILQPQVQPS